MMVYVILALFGLAVFHFVYEAIVLPSLRLEVRFRLFELRDELRELKRVKAEELGDDLFDALQQSLNTTLAMLHRLDVRNVYQAFSAVAQNEELRRRIERRRSLVESCPIPEYRSIYERHVVLVAKALLANSAATFIYMLPLVLAVVLFSRLVNLVRQVFFLRDHEIESIFPEARAAH